MGQFLGSAGGSCERHQENVEMDVVRVEIGKSLTPDERVRFLAILFRLAQVEQVSRLERDRLQPIAAWLEAGDEELENAIRLAYNPERELAGLLNGLRGNAKGTLLFRESCAVVWADGVKSSQEAATLAELALLLGLSNDTVGTLDTPLACSPEGERRFLEHLKGTSSRENEH